MTQPERQHRVFLELADRIRVRLWGQVIADSRRGVVVREDGQPPRYYVPREDVRAQVTPAASGGLDPWKGRWRHLDLTVGNQRVAEGGWTYFHTTAVAEPIHDMVAFYDDKVDSIEVELTDA